MGEEGRTYDVRSLGHALRQASFQSLTLPAFGSVFLGVKAPDGCLIMEISDRRSNRGACIRVVRIGERMSRPDRREGRGEGGRVTFGDLESTEDCVLDGDAREVDGNRVKTEGLLDAQVQVRKSGGREGGREGWSERRKGGREGGEGNWCRTFVRVLRGSFAWGR